MGSGFVIDPRGIVMTNNHVVNGAAEVKVRFADGREYVATGIKTDPRTDIAILRVNPASGEHFEALPLGNSDQSEVGDWVLGDRQPVRARHDGDRRHHQCQGTSASTRANAKTSFRPTPPSIRATAADRLLNLDGEVIGINTAISTRSGGYDGVGFAVPINMAHWVSDQLIPKAQSDVRIWASEFSRSTERWPRCST